MGGGRLPARHVVCPLGCPHVMSFVLYRSISTVSCMPVSMPDAGRVASPGMWFQPAWLQPARGLTRRGFSRGEGRTLKNLLRQVFTPTQIGPYGARRFPKTHTAFSLLLSCASLGRVLALCGSHASHAQHAEPLCRPLSRVECTPTVARLRVCIAFPDTQHATVGAHPQPKDTHSDTGSHASPRALRRCGGCPGSGGRGGGPRRGARCEGRPSRRPPPPPPCPPGRAYGEGWTAGCRGRLQKPPRAAKAARRRPRSRRARVG